MIASPVSKPPRIFSISVRIFLFSIQITGLLTVSALSSLAFSADRSLNDCTLAELQQYRMLAKASALVYDDSPPDLESTPSGCVALVREESRGNLVIAFRGSMLGDRNPKHRFSNLGGAIVRRNYRDWVATNLKQTAGFLPRQYVEAAALVEKHVRAHPVDKLVFVTGHSKGGGAAAYAYVAAYLSSELSPEQLRRIRCVTFNAAVVREQNWRRLFRRSGSDNDGPAPNSIQSLVMQDDPVSKIMAGEEREYVERILISPTSNLAPSEQHGIQVIITEIETRLTRAYQNQN